jgi:hypothetical protein
MTYHQLITRAVDELDSNTEEARRALYERARTALLAQLRSNKHVLVLADITRQRRALEEAIGKVEADAARKLRVETQELRSAAPPGRTPNGGAQVSSAPPRRERANRPLAALPEDGMIERHLPVPSRAGEMWGYVSNELREAALGGDTAEFFSVLEMALSIEGLEWALK